MERIYITGQCCEFRVKNAILWAIFFKCTHSFKAFSVAFRFALLSFSFLLLGYANANFKATNTNVSQILLVNNLRIPTIKNTKFPGYYFHRNTNIWCYFTICISVPVMRYQISTTKYLDLDLQLYLPLVFRNWNWN